MNIQLVHSFQSAPRFENLETAPEYSVKMQALKLVISKRGEIVNFDKCRYTINKKHQYRRT